MIQKRMDKGISGENKSKERNDRDPDIKHCRIQAKKHKVWQHSTIQYVLKVLVNVITQEK